MNASFPVVSRRSLLKGAGALVVSFELAPEVGDFELALGFAEVGFAEERTFTVGTSG